jgi:hypothetical protein
MTDIFRKKIFIEIISNLLFSKLYLLMEYWCFYNQFLHTYLMHNYFIKTYMNN